MPNCPACGSTVDENMVFCPQCGKPLRNPQDIHATIAGVIDFKPTTILANGLFIGSGITALICMLATFFSLNATYEKIGSFIPGVMPSVGVQVAQRDIVFLISMTVFGMIFGAYLLLVGLISQFNRKSFLSLTIEDKQARIGSGLMNAGVLSSSLSSANLVRQIYNHEFGWHLTVYAIILLVGLSMIIAGVIILQKKAAKSAIKV